MHEDEDSCFIDVFCSDGSRGQNKNNERLIKLEQSLNSVQRQLDLLLGLVGVPNRTTIAAATIQKHVRDAQHRSRLAVLQFEASKNWKRMFVLSNSVLCIQKHVKRILKERKNRLIESLVSDMVKKACERAAFAALLTNDDSAPTKPCIITTKLENEHVNADHESLVASEIDAIIETQIHEDFALLSPVSARQRWARLTNRIGKEVDAPLKRKPKEAKKKFARRRKRGQIRNLVFS